MNQDNQRELKQHEIEKLQRRIECLVDIQDALRAALQEPCAKEKRRGIESSLRRHKAKEEKARQELAALQGLSPLHCSPPPTLTFPKPSDG